MRFPVAGSAIRASRRLLDHRTFIVVHIRVISRVITRGGGGIMDMHDALQIGYVFISRWIPRDESVVTRLELLWTLFDD